MITHCGLGDFDWISAKNIHEKKFFNTGTGYPEHLQSPPLLEVLKTWLDKNRVDLIYSW